MIIAVCMICLFFDQRVRATHKTRNLLMVKRFEGYDEIFVCRHHYNVAREIEWAQEEKAKSRTVETQ